MSNDSLKPITQLNEPDPRQELFSVYDISKGNFRLKTIEDHYSRIEAIQLNETVPSSIQIHFDVARNLLLYSWYVYRFISAAELYAYISVEYALKQRISQGEDQNAQSIKDKGLKQLLDYAIKSNWIQDEGFAQYRRIRERGEETIKTMRENFPEQFNDVEFIPPAVQEYTKHILEAIPKLRNEYAHGSELLISNALLLLEICRDLINMLFVDPRK